MSKLAKIMFELPLLYTSIIVGFAYGVFFTFIIRLTSRFSKKQIDIKSSASIILSKVLVVIVCNLIMTPAAQVLSSTKMTWETMLSGYPTRFMKQVIECPVDCIIMLLVLLPILEAYKRVFPAKDSAKNLFKESEDAK